MFNKDSELPDRPIKARFNALFTKSWTGWKTQIINNWANDAWRFKVETAFESTKFNADKDKDLTWFCQQKDRLTALYSDIRTTEQSSAEDIINILEEVTTRTKISSSRVNLKTRLNKPWKESVDKNPQENPNNFKYKSADTIRKCHICQSTTHLSNTCPKRGKINEHDIEKEPDVEKDDAIEENSDDKSSLFAEFSKDIESINSTFDIMEYYSPLPQLSNGQLDLLRIQDDKLMKTKPNRGKGYTSDKEPLGAIIGHEVDIILTIERPYPPLLRRPTYPASPKSREALEIHIKELLDLGVIRKMRQNEEVEITTPVIVAWHNEKSRMVGDLRALKTYTVTDR
ncbi:hypothetical protein O181_066767 [Austropuccinia psidii MF-1]|uniref:Uncharacterized protein n=1 Tax=Austropuccinia psidii MF-1 TaxID=1389203 RepID=A0A9Q3I4L5_9BASI|nr:hypothetical protein [Austropuccinia psidii MF-1]